MIDDMKHNLQIIPIPAFKDNYIWLLHDSNNAVVVDPGDATPVFEVVKNLNLHLHTILITHHHHDHIGGVARLIEAYPNVKVYAPKLEQYGFKHLTVDETEILDITAFNLKLKVISLPGHTLGHVAYYAEDEENAQNILFCGDTLFGAGCGRLFEGTPEQMFASLQKLAALPQDTKVYCTHEYTMHNINFALTLEPDNQALILRQQTTLALRDLQKPSLPSTIALELATNPFLRCDNSAIKSSIQQPNASHLQVFTAIRELRNHY
ncbi:MAG: hydroxyacylglutathione hydrolase [Bacteroidia bacterium]|nr:hydroxyacylglutathione hydrolase [Methylotenera sp.]